MNVRTPWPEPASRRRPTQAERIARSRSALLESAARGFSRYGYGNLILERVASEAGYTRGALYHQFEDKEDLALAVIDWVNENWMREVDRPAKQEPDPVAELIALARGHAVFCRRDIARVVMALRVEFSGQDHPVGREIERISETGVKRVARLIEAGRRMGTIPAGPPARAVAFGFFGAMEGTVIQVAGQAPHDEVLAARAVAGVLGLDHDEIPECDRECAPTSVRLAAGYRLARSSAPRRSHPPDDAVTQSLQKGWCHAPVPKRSCDWRRRTRIGAGFAGCRLQQPHCVSPLPRTGGARRHPPRRRPRVRGLPLRTRDRCRGRQ